MRGPLCARLKIAEARGSRSVEIRGSAAFKHEASAAKSFSSHYDLIAPGAFTAYIPARLHSAGAPAGIDPVVPEGSNVRCADTHGNDHFTLSISHWHRH